MNGRSMVIAAAFLGPASGPALAAPDAFSDGFDSFNTARWACEYACPAVSDGMARFTLEPGAANTQATWSKLSHKDRTFQYGTYSMRYRLSRRPLETEVWAGWALYAEDSDGIQEINFGIETACKSRCDDQTLIFESYRNSSNQEVIVKTGASLFEWHTVVLTYTATAITLDFDGKRLAEIKDPAKIPTVPMKLIPGARVVNGSLDSPFHLDIDDISFTPSTTPVALAAPWAGSPSDVHAGRFGAGSFYNALGAVAGSRKGFSFSR